ncbi:MAG TPA: flagellar hook-associated protein FlgK [Kineosporiaceae bacterium]
MTGFSTFNTASTGMSAAQRALDATSQNIVNVNTPGYSRQRVLTQSIGMPVAASIHTSLNGSFIGGVSVVDVSRIHNAFLEASRAAAGARQAAITSQTDILTSAQQLLSEPGDTGLQSTLDSFYSSWHDLANKPGDTAAGSVVIQRALAVADQLHSLSNGVSAQWTTARSNLVDLVSRINQSASDLAKLNESIAAGQQSGKPVNELLDTRDQLVRQLASLAGASSAMDDLGRLSVNINGVTIVTGNEWQAVTLSGADDITAAVSDPPTLSVGAFTVPVQSGSAAGLLASLRTDLPSLSGSIDGVADRLVTAVNTVYSTGYAPNGSTANTFFSGTDARNITVVPTSGTALAIAAQPGTLDGSIARQVGDLAVDSVAQGVLGSPGPSVGWRELTTSLGVQVQSLKTAQSVQDAVVAAAEDAVQADAGVNLDEEMTNMMQYQRAYQASARVITTADELLDTLINRTGKVGL